MKDADILVGILWTRLGTPTGEAESGTVEEIGEFVANGKPVLLYFSSVPFVPDSVDSEQYRRLKEFKESVRSQGLVFDFHSVLELRDLLYRHLNSTVHDLPRKTPGQSLPSSNSLAETPKQQISMLAQGYDSFVRRLEVEWASERESGTLSTDKGIYILNAARSDLVGFERSIVTTDR